MSVRFDADGEDYTSTAGLPSGTTFSVTCWVRIAVDRNTWSAVWALDAGTGDYTYLETNEDGVTLAYWDDTDGVNPKITGPLMTVGTWYFAALTKSGANGTLYWAAASDVTLSSASSTTLGNVAPTTFRIGESPWGAEWLNGNVAALKVWTGVQLTQAEVEQERWSTTPARTDSLNRWYPFHVAETTDYSGAGNTLSGGTGTSTEDGPPIPWRVSRRRLVLPAGTTTQTVVAQARASTLTIHQPKVIQTVKATAIAAGTTLHQPKVIQIVKANAVGPGTTVHNPTILPGAVTVVSQARASTLTLYAPKVVQIVKASALAAGSTLYSPKVTQTVKANALGPGATVHNPTVSGAGAQTVVANALAAGTALHTPKIIQIVKANAISGTTIHSPSVRQTVKANALGPGTIVHQPRVVMVVRANHRASTLTLYSPKLIHLVKAAHLAAATALHTPTVTGGESAPHVPEPTKAVRIGAAANKSNRIGDPANQADRLGNRANKVVEW